MNYSVNLSSGQTVEVVIGEAAQINVEQALNYIESGRVEITKYVNEWAKPEITNYTNEYAKPIVTEIVNQTTKPLIDDYLNTTTKPQIDEYVADNVKPYADSAQDSAAKAKISEDNAKTSETNAKASELAAASSAGVASAAAVTATEAKDYTAKVLTDENLKTVGQDLQSADSNIKTVATNIVNVNTVAKNIDNVNLLAPHTEAMEALAPDIMDVVTVAGIAEQTKNVSANMAHVVAVDNNKANIDKAVTNEANITTVATDMNNVKTVANNIDIIDNVATNKSNINNVSVNMPFVKGVSDNMTNVVAVDRNKANIDNVASNKTNIINVAENIAAVNNVSENMADVKNAVQSANDAKLWAVGTKTEKPEGSSKYWAEQAKNAVKIPDATETVKGIVRLATSEEVTAGTNDSAAITPLKLKSNLDTKQDKSTAVNYNNISNCITYIPQDIKLELNNGTLTLKAGSKVYVPNGSGVFDKVIIESDKTVETSSRTGSVFVFARQNGSIIYGNQLVYTANSGTTPGSGLYYKTDTNEINIYNSGVFLDGKFSLPIAICTVNSGTVTSIDQVFNGFGYIGSTVFTLPGVKGLIPNGRNADGSLNSIEVVNDRVKTSTFPVGITFTSINMGLTTDVVIDLNFFTYYEKENIIKNLQQSLVQEINCATLDVNNSKITSFTPKTVFHALDYNDSSRLESVINTKVNKSGDTMTGNLIINGNIPAYILQDSTLDLSQTYTDYKDEGFVLQRDKNGADGSHIAFTHDQYGNNIIRLVASDGVGQDRKTNTIGIWVNKLGNNGTFASQCNYDASIVTTVSHGDNWIRFGNGLQICWGAGNNGQWTFPVPFKDANYGLTMSTQTRHGGEIWISELGLLNKTNTGFYKADSAKTNPFTWTAIGYWY